MTLLAASTKADDTVQVSEWVNNSPVATASDPTNAGILNPIAATGTTAAQNSVNRGVPTTNPPPTIPVETPVAPPAVPTTNNIPLTTGQGSIIYLPSTGPVQAPHSTTTSHEINAASITVTTSAPLASATSYPLSQPPFPQTIFQTCQHGRSRQDQLP